LADHRTLTLQQYGTVDNTKIPLQSAPHFSAFQGQQDDAAEWLEVPFDEELLGTLAASKLRKFKTS